jgi:hypothetical protein
VRRRLVVLAVFAVAGLGVFAGTSSADSVRKCIPNREAGIEVKNHVTAIVYCGSAKVTLLTGGKTTRYSGGACLRVAGTINVGMGKFTTIGHTPLYTSFYLRAPAGSDGTFNLGVLTVQSKGKSLNANKVKVVVTGKRSRGTFSGKFVDGSKSKFTGSFTCK